MFPGMPWAVLGLSQNVSLNPQTYLRTAMAEPRLSNNNSRKLNRAASSFQISSEIIFCFPEISDSGILVFPCTGIIFDRTVYI
jgi:hypothetical protein